MVQIRDLPREEWGRLNTLSALEGYDLPDPNFANIIIAEEDGRIIAFWATVQVAHIEPVWIDPAYRGTTLVRGLWRKIRANLDQFRIKKAFCFSERPETSDYLERLGLVPLPYDVYYYDSCLSHSSQQELARA